MLLKSKGVHRLLPKYGRMDRVYIYHDRLPTIDETVDSMINNNADDASISIVKDWFTNLVENLDSIVYSFSGAWVYFYSPQSDIITEHILNLNERLLQSDYVCVEDIFYNVESAANLILCFGFTNLLHEPKCPENKFIITESIRQIYARIHSTNL
jgi:hypothetical protein